MTAFIFIGTAYLGYAYARLRHDEVLRRQMHTKYTNFMWWFNIWSDWYEVTYARAVAWFMAFDSSYRFWRQRRTLIADYWA